MMGKVDVNLPVHSSDVLFPEPHQSQHSQSFDDYYSQGTYSMGTPSTYSTYSHEVKYIFEPDYGVCRQIESVPEEPGSRHPITYNDNIYAPPRHRQVKPNFNAPKYCIRRNDERRRTWSPPTCERNMGTSSSFQIRSYYSNDQLDVDNNTNGNMGNTPVVEENIYEELDAMSPPKLTPISGILNPKNPKTCLIKPIAFKPVVPPHMRYVSTPQSNQRPSPRSSDFRLTSHCRDEGYASQDCNSVNHSHNTSNASNLSPGSYQLDGSDRSTLSYGEFRQTRPESSSYTCSSHSRISSNHVEGYIGTPSPSDSGVGELEAMLRDKDAEIAHLRDTLEKNETAILKVCEEKRQNWEVEMKEVTTEWERQLRLQQEKAFKTEQALLMQLFKLQQERKALRLDVEQLRTEKEHCTQKYDELNKDYTELKSKLEEVQWDLCQKSGEISLLKTQLKESKEETSNRNNDLVGLKNQMKDTNQDKAELVRQIEQLQTELQEARQSQSQSLLEPLSKEAVSSSTQCSPKVAPPVTELVPNGNASSGACSISPTTVEGLRAELLRVQADLEKCRVAFDREREQWFEEKNKVIRYQKHLQLNYVQMYRKNKMLEAEVEQLMVEIENRDLHLHEDGQLQQESSC